ncbi:MAG: hypothetical protein QNL04_15120 [SAR324 cluster bacterium]|nr:hypothetical protein [SAR324 cluster bacterium]
MVFQRKSQRFDHVYISLKFQEQADWHWVKAYNWSEEGFHFLFDSPVPIGEKFQFKKGLDVFNGETVWSRQQISNEDLFFMGMNRLLADKFSEKFKTTKFDYDFIDLLRGQDVAAKMEYAQKFLGFFVSRNMMLEEIEKNQWADKKQFGVKIVDPNWKKIFDQVLHYSDTVAGITRSLDKKLDAVKVD